MRDNLRKVEIFDGTSWRQSEFRLIRKGDKFRLFECTGETVIGHNGITEFIAESDSYENDGVFTVKII